MAHPTVNLTTLDATLTAPPVNDDSKELTKTLTPLEATLTKKRGWGSRPFLTLLFFRRFQFLPELSRFTLILLF